MESISNASNIASSYSSQVVFHQMLARIKSKP